jgi:hypothetical protein
VHLTRTGTRSERQWLGPAAALLVVVLSGCSGSAGDGGSGGRTDEDSAASVADFCGAFQDFYDGLSVISVDETDLGKTLKAAAAKIEAADTPQDITADAAAGLKVLLGQIDALADDATADDVAAQEGALTKEQRVQTRAFQEYLAVTCPGITNPTGGTAGSTP